jgi:hypothetical protein
MLTFTLVRILTKAKLNLTVTNLHFRKVAIPVSAGMWTVFNTVFITTDIVCP